MLPVTFFHHPPSLTLNWTSPHLSSSPQLHPCCLFSFFIHSCSCEPSMWGRENLVSCDCPSRLLASLHQQISSDDPTPHPIHPSHRPLSSYHPINSYHFDMVLTSEMSSAQSERFFFPDLSHCFPETKNYLPTASCLLSGSKIAGDYP